MYLMINIAIILSLLAVTLLGFPNNLSHFVLHVHATKVDDGISHLKPVSSVDVSFSMNKNGKTEAFVRLQGASLLHSHGDVDASKEANGRNLGDDDKLEFHLEEMINVFGDGALLEIATTSNMDDNIVKPLKSDSKSFVMRPSEDGKGQNKEWAVFTIRTDKDNNHIVQGVFTINDGNKMVQLNHVDQHLRSISGDNRRKLREAATGNHVLEDVDLERVNRMLSDVKKSGPSALRCDVGEEKVKDKNKPKGKPVLPDITQSATADYYKFTPDCFTGDSLTWQFEIGIAVDYGYYKAVGSTEDAVKASIESIVASTRIVYMRQMNVVPVVQNIVISTSTTTPFPLSGDPASGTCVSDMSYALTRFGDWNAANNDNVATRRRGLWHLLTGCFQQTSTAGYANMNSLCDLSRNVGVTKYIAPAYTWLIFAHELGHGFGATHSFGIGGLMDYNNPIWNGLAQFDSGKRSEMCSEINLVVQTCKYFKALTSGSSCGNGVIEAGEMCECLAFGSTSCGSCVNCNLAKPSIQCSSQNYQMRTTPADMAAEMIFVKPESLSDPQCCSSAGEMYTPVVSCNSGRDVCANGKCIKVCSAYNLPGCGALNSGCTQACTYNGQCTSSLTSASGVKISWLPEGTKCGSNSACSGGSCKALAPTTSIPTRKPATGIPTTVSPTSNPTTKKPTNTPTTVRPTYSPFTIPPSLQPSTIHPSKTPTTKGPSSTPSKTPTKLPSTKPTFRPTTNPTIKPSKLPTTVPTRNPTKNPTVTPTRNPIRAPTSNPVKAKVPTTTPTRNPTKNPTITPTRNPLRVPTSPPVKPKVPTTTPTRNPTKNPTVTPTRNPVRKPTTKSPTRRPTTRSPTKRPTTPRPSVATPTLKPTLKPVIIPTMAPTTLPSKIPSFSPTHMPTIAPTTQPTKSPVLNPTANPSKKPTKKPVRSG